MAFKEIILPSRRCNFDDDDDCGYPDEIQLDHNSSDGDESNDESNDFKLHSRLYRAVKDQNTEAVSKLISKGADVNYKDYEDNPLLYLAVKSDNESILKLLLNAGANVNITNKKDETPLYLAIRQRNEGIIKTLLKAGVQLNSEDQSMQTPLRVAVNYGSFSISSILVEAGADVSASCEDTPLHAAASSGRINIMKLLLDAGADVNARSNLGYTPLHDAAYKLNSVNIIKFLMEAGADPNSHINAGDTPFSVYIKKIDHSLSSRKRNLIEKSLRFLIEYTDINITNRDRENLLTYPLQSSKEIKFFHKIVLEHLAKIKLLDLPLDSRLLTVISNRAEYNDYFTKCTKELEKAKSTKLHQCWVTFFNVLSDGERKLVKYAGNKDLVNDVKKTNLEEKFPIYGAAMKYNIYKGTTARRSFDGAASVLNEYIPIFSSTHLVIRDTLEALNEDDWKNLQE